MACHTLPHSLLLFGVLDVGARGLKAGDDVDEDGYWVCGAWRVEYVLLDDDDEESS